MQATALGSVFDFRYVLSDYGTTKTRALPQGGAVDSAIYRDGVAEPTKNGPDPKVRPMSLYRSIGTNMAWFQYNRRCHQLNQVEIIDGSLPFGKRPGRDPNR